MRLNYIRSRDRFAWPQDLSPISVSNVHHWARALWITATHHYPFTDRTNHSSIKLSQQKYFILNFLKLLQTQRINFILFLNNNQTFTLWNLYTIFYIINVHVISKTFHTKKKNPRIKIPPQIKLNTKILNYN